MIDANLSRHRRRSLVIRAHSLAFFPSRPIAIVPRVCAAAQHHAFRGVMIFVFRPFHSVVKYKNVSSVAVARGSFTMKMSVNQKGKRGQ